MGQTAKLVGVPDFWGQIAKELGRLDPSEDDRFVAEAPAEPAGAGTGNDAISSGRRAAERWLADQ